MYSKFKKNEEHSIDTEKLLFKGDSAYNHITVTESNGVRLMAFGIKGDEHETACNMVDPDDPVFEYIGLMSPALALKPDTREILLIGLGGGYLPGLLQRHRPDIVLKVIEIDALVVDLANSFFDFHETENVSVVIADGRTYLEENLKKYDQIWIDAYDGSYIPGPLTTLEFISLCRERLKPDGVLAQNVHEGNPLYMSHQATITEVFDYFYLFRGVRDGNAVLIAQRDIPRPQTVLAAFSAGLKRYGTKLATINLKSSISKAKVVSYTDKLSILTD